MIDVCTLSNNAFESWILSHDDDDDDDDDDDGDGDCDDDDDDDDDDDTISMLLSVLQEAHCYWPEMGCVFCRIWTVSRNQPNKFFNGVQRHLITW